jgi:hypothetical protein
VDNYQYPTPVNQTALFRIDQGEFNQQKEDQQNGRDEDSQRPGEPLGLIFNLVQDIRCDTIHFFDSQAFWSLVR